MVVCFPDPYPDEILFSVCARFQERTQYPSKKSTIVELFGTRSATAIVGFPSRLSKLLSGLSFEPGYTANWLIDNCTFLPFCSPFLPIERVDQLREDMKGNDGLKAHMRSGLSSSRIQSPKWFQFCPLCVEQDRKQLGECYWHRLHQIPGIKVCPIHKVLLENSDSRSQGRRIRYELISSEKAIQACIPKLLDLSDPLHQKLLRISQDTIWLLNQRNFLPGLEPTHNRYIKLLVAQGLATYTGQVRVRKLLEAFKDYYPSRFLESIQCEIREEDNNNWLFRLVRSPKHTCHPLYHLLFIQFLGYTVEEFFQVSDGLSPFGDGPWPCLNPVCRYFRQLCIQTCELKRDKTHGGRITATFSCKCGFMYSRLGPDTSPEDLFKVGRIKVRGVVWEALLKEFWHNPSLTLAEMANRLGADSQSVKYHAARLKLTYPRLGPTARQIQKTVAPPSQAEVVKSTKLSEYRTEWLEIMRKKPGAGRFELAGQHRRIHSWLNFYDREWLHDHLPALKSSPPALAQVDWQQRDTEILIAVKAAAEQLRNKLGKPERLTKTAIASTSGYLALIQRQLDKLPLTAEALTGLVETTEAFAVRRVHWIAECFRQEGICPRDWQIVKQAGLKPYIMEMPKVKQAIADVLMSPASI